MRSGSVPPLAALGYPHQSSPCHLQVSACQLPALCRAALASCHEQQFCLPSSYPLSALISSRQWKTCQGQGKTSNKGNRTAHRNQGPVPAAIPLQVRCKGNYTAAMSCTSLLVQTKAGAGQLLCVDPTLAQAHWC